jgi:hypothetical protein
MSSPFYHEQCTTLHTSAAFPKACVRSMESIEYFFNASTQTMPDKVVLNLVTMTDEEANINFG